MVTTSRPAVNLNATFNASFTATKGVLDRGVDACGNRNRVKWIGVVERSMRSQSNVMPPNAKPHATFAASEVFACVQLAEIPGAH